MYSVAASASALTSMGRLRKDFGEHGDRTQNQSDFVHSFVMHLSVVVVVGGRARTGGPGVESGPQKRDRGRKIRWMALPGLVSRSSSHDF